jgi:hypothetical protein
LPGALSGLRASNFCGSRGVFRRVTLIGWPALLCAIALLLPSAGDSQPDARASGCSMAGVRQLVVRYVAAFNGGNLSVPRRALSASFEVQVVLVGETR